MTRRSVFLWVSFLVLVWTASNMSLSYVNADSFSMMPPGEPCAIYAEVGQGAFPFTDDNGHYYTAEYVQDRFCEAYERSAQHLGATREQGGGEDFVHWYWPSEEKYPVQDFETDDMIGEAVIIFTPQARTAFTIRDEIWDYYWPLNGPHGLVDGEPIGGPVTEQIETSYGSIQFFETAYIIQDVNIDETYATSYANAGYWLSSFYFVDAPDSHEFFNDIQGMKEHDLSNGCQWSTTILIKLYCPEAPATRGEFGLILARAIYGSDGSLPVYDPSEWVFEDENVSDLERRAAETLYRDNIVQGYINDNGDRVFGFDEYVTRGAVMAMVVKSLHLPRGNTIPAHPFIDINGHTFEWDIALGYYYGITQGFSDDTFRPDSLIRRGALARFLCIPFLNNCNGDRSELLRNDMWESVAPGIRLDNNNDGIQIAIADPKNPNIEVRIAADPVSIDPLRFDTHSLIELVQDHSDTRLNDNELFPFIAVNGTAFSPCNLQGITESSGSVLRDNILSTYYSHEQSAAGFLWYDRNGDVDGTPETRVYRIFDPDEFIPRILLPNEHLWDIGGDGTTRTILEPDIIESDITLGYSPFNVLLSGGIEVDLHSDLIRDFENERVTAIGIGELNGSPHIFMVQALPEVPLAEITEELLAQGADSIILLDGGGSSQFYAFGHGVNVHEAELENYSGCHVGGARTRPIINSFVIFSDSSRLAQLDIDLQGGEIDTSDGILIDTDENTFPLNNIEVTASSMPSVTLTYAPQPITYTYPLEHVERFFYLSAQYEDGSPATPSGTYTISVPYDPYDIPSNISEGDLSLYYWDGLSWVPELTSFVDNEAQRVVATPNNFGKWAILAKDNSMCRIYAVHDENLADSQFFTIDYQLVTDNIAPLGPLHSNEDLEGLAVDPLSGGFYASSSGSETENSKLYAVDNTTGEIYLINEIRDEIGTGFVGVSSLAFRADGTLWGFAKDGEHELQGLIQIDPTTAIASMVKKQDDLEIEGIAWTPDGSMLWLAVENKLYRHELGGTINFAFRPDIVGDIEGLEFRPDGLLLTGIHEGSDLNVYAIDTQSRDILISDSFDTDEFTDVEALVWPSWCTGTNMPTLTEVNSFNETTLDYRDNAGDGFYISIPANAVNQTTTLGYTNLDTSGTEGNNLTNVGYGFRLNAYQSGKYLSEFEFDTPIYVAVNYSDSSVEGMDETKLRLRYWEDGNWIDAACGEYDHNLEENRLSVPVCHLTEFGIFAGDDEPTSITQLLYPARPQSIVTNYLELGVVIVVLATGALLIVRRRNSMNAFGK